jgi:5-methylcytosine-specific restriction protein A
MKTLKTDLPMLVSSLKVLDTKAGSTERIRGSRWMKIRQRTLVAGAYTCVDCGRVHTSNEVDHETPLEQGGSNEQSNLAVRCEDCHKAKTKREAQDRYRVS